jgi:hypothetical protein
MTLVSGRLFAIYFSQLVIRLFVAKKNKVVLLKKERISVGIKIKE